MKNKINNNDFYMIVASANTAGSTAPRMKHPTYELALKEARRLATANIGTKFYILKPIEVVEATATITENRIEDGALIPKSVLEEIGSSVPEPENEYLNPGDGPDDDDQ